MIDMFHESLPNVPIYVQSIPGVQEWVKDSKPGLQNDRIKLVNNLLATWHCARAATLSILPKP